MTLEDIFIGTVDSFGPTRYSNSFGWICVYTGKNLFGGYKVIDNEILLLWLILSPAGFAEALDAGFEKFDFGKTWAQTEVVGQEDITRVEPFILDAYNFTRIRKRNIN